MARLKQQTKQPGRLSQSPADKLIHFILVRGPSQLHPSHLHLAGGGEHRGLIGFFWLPSRTAVNAQTGVCTPAGGLVTGEPHPDSFFTLGAYSGNGGGGEPVVL